MAEQELVVQIAGNCSSRTLLSNVQWSAFATVNTRTLRAGRTASVWNCEFYDLQTWFFIRICNVHYANCKIHGRWYYCEETIFATCMYYVYCVLYAVARGCLGGFLDFGRLYGPRGFEHKPSRETISSNSTRIIAKLRVRPSDHRELNDFSLVRIIPTRHGPCLHSSRDKEQTRTLNSRTGRKFSTETLSKSSLSHGYMYHFFIV